MFSESKWMTTPEGLAGEELSEKPVCTTVIREIPPTETPGLGLEWQLLLSSYSSKSRGKSTSDKQQSGVRSTDNSRTWHVYTEQHWLNKHLLLFDGDIPTYNTLLNLKQFYPISPIPATLPLPPSVHCPVPSCFCSLICYAEDTRLSTNKDD